MMTSVRNAPDSPMLGDARQERATEFSKLIENLSSWLDEAEQNGVKALDGLKCYRDGLKH